MKKSFVPTVLALLVSAPLATLAAEKTPKKSGFAAADANGDGKISPAEYVAAMKGKLDETAAKARFAELDKNKDGSLSPEEFSAGAAAKKNSKKKMEGN
jgi:Ca2+-binding EF-hand superfamily protein